MLCKKEILHLNTEVLLILLSLSVFQFFFGFFYMYSNATQHKGSCVKGLTDSWTSKRDDAKACRKNTLAVTTFPVITTVKLIEKAWLSLVCCFCSYWPLMREWLLMAGCWMSLISLWLRGREYCGLAVVLNILSRYIYNYIDTHWPLLLFAWSALYLCPLDYKYMCNIVKLCIQLEKL